MPESTDTGNNAYELIVDAYDFPVYFVDTDYVYRAVNQAFLDNFGKIREDVIGRTIVEVMGEEHFVLYSKPNIDKTRSGETVNIQDWYADPGAGTVYLNVKYIPYRNHDGTVIGTAIISQHITEFKKTQMELERNERQLRRVQRLARVGFWERNLKTDHISLSDDLYYLYGLGPAAEPGPGILFQYIHPDDRQAAIWNYQDVATSRDGHFEFSHRIIRADGEVRYLKVQGELTYDFKGEPLHILGASIDVTELKRAEEELLSYEQIVNNVTSYMTFISPDYRYLAVNQHYLDIFQLSREQVIGRRCEEIIGHENFHNITKPNIDRAFAGTTLTEHAWSHHKVLGNRCLEMTYTPYRDPYGKIKGVIAVTRDITEQKQAEEALKRYEDIINSVSDYMTFVTPDYRFLAVNQPFLDAFGLTREQVIGRKSYEVVGEENFKTISKTGYDHAMTGETYSVKGWTMQTTRGRRFLEFQYYPYRDEDGVITGIITVARDLTEARQAQEILERYEQIVNSVSDTMSYLDRDLRYLAVNQRFLEAFHVSREAIIGRTIHEVIGGDKFYQANKPNLDKALNGEGAVKESWFYQPGLGDRYIKLYYTPYRDETGAVQGIIINGHDLTEQKRAEEALKRYGQMVNASMDILAFLDTEYCFIAVNDPFLKFYDKTREEIIGHSVVTVLGEERFRNLSKPMLDRCLAGEDIRFQTEFQPPGQGLLNLDISCTPYRGDEDKVIGAIVTIHDITDLIAVQNDLQLSREKFKAILDTSQDWIWESSMLTDEYIYCNPAVEQILGYTPEEVKAIGGANFEFFAVDEHKKIENLVSQSLSEKRGWRGVELKCIHRSGAVRYMESSAVPVLDHAGNVTGFRGINRDITEKKIAADELADKERRLKEAQRIGRLGFWEWNMVTDEIYWSDELYRMIGYNPGEFEPTNDTILENVHPEDRDTVRECVLRAIKAGVPYRVENRFINRDGEVRYHQISGEMHLGEDGKPQFMMGTTLDITPMKQVQLELARHRDHLEELVNERTHELKSAQQELLKSERLATLGKLTATVSHELRNPLGASNLALYTLKKFINVENPRLLDAFNRLERNIKRCDSIIDELLDFTRLGNFDLRPHQFDAWLTSVLDELTSPDGITIKRELNLGDAFVNIEPDRLRRAVINIYDNGCHAMAASDDPAAIMAGAELSITTRINNLRVELIISDKGAGIPEANIQRIFEPLYSTKNFGVGLGLPTVKQIMENHGGGIEIKSIENSGTDVILWLPLAAEMRKVAS